MNFSVTLIPTDCNMFTDFCVAFFMLKKLYSRKYDNFNNHIWSGRLNNTLCRGIKQVDSGSSTFCHTCRRELDHILTRLIPGLIEV